MSSKAKKLGKTICKDQSLKATKEKVTYTLNDTCIDFLAEIDCLDLIDGDKLDVKVWEKYYKKRMKTIGDYIKENLDELLEKMNNKAFKDASKTD